jgi:hypothetical protein
MDLLNLPHLHESARRAAGSFLSPLTNAIGEQRRLVDSLAVVSKVRVEECKHMMVWSKSQVPYSVSPWHVAIGCGLFLFPILLTNSPSFLTFNCANRQRTLG